MPLFNAVPVDAPEDRKYDYETAQKMVQKAEWEAMVRRNIFIDPKLKVIRNPMDPRLYAPNKRVLNPQDPKTMEQARSLVGLMFVENGLGLAASQVGLNLRMCAINIGNGNSIVLFNPKIVNAPTHLMSKGVPEENADWSEEACISHLGVKGEVLRLKQFEFTASTFTHPKVRKYNASGMFARVLQHELDHIRGEGGRLFTDLGENVRGIVADANGQLRLQAENKSAEEFGFAEPEV